MHLSLEPDASYATHPSVQTNGTYILDETVLVCTHTHIYAGGVRRQAVVYGVGALRNDQAFVCLKPDVYVDVAHRSPTVLFDWE